MASCGLSYTTALRKPKPLAQGGDPLGEPPSNRIPDMSDIAIERSQDLAHLEELLSPILPTVQEDEAKLTVRLPVSLKETLKVDAEARGLNLSDYVRLKLSDSVLPLSRRSRPQVGTIERGVIVELNRIGVNLNQMMRRLNSQKTSKANVTDRQTLTQLLDTLRRVELALITEPEALEPDA